MSHKFQPRPVQLGRIGIGTCPGGLAPNHTARSESPRRLETSDPIFDGLVDAWDADCPPESQFDLSTEKLGAKGW